MDNLKSSTMASSELRSKADEFLKQSLPISDAMMSDFETKRLFHQLQVHQIELEMQNEELQTALQAAESVNAANAAKSQFQSNMNHEIRTFMSGIILMAQLLEMTELTLEQQEYVHNLKTSGINLVHLITDILDLSKTESQLIVLEKRDVDLRTEITEVVSSLSLSAHKKGLTFSALIDPDVPQKLNVNTFRMGQIINNLVSNAIKFTFNGSVCLRISKDAEDDNQVTLRIQVQDSGIGIAADNLETIFEPFTQADNSTTRTFGGTGLGLTISDQLAKLMNGAVNVESVEGEGSSFWVTVAIDKQPTASGFSSYVSGDK